MCHSNFNCHYSCPVQSYIHYCCQATALWRWLFYHRLYINKAPAVLGKHPGRDLLQCAAQMQTWHISPVSWCPAALGCAFAGPKPKTTKHLCCALQIHARVLDLLNFGSFITLRITCSNKKCLNFNLNTLLPQAFQCLWEPCRKTPELSDLSMKIMRQLNGSQTFTSKGKSFHLKNNKGLGALFRQQGQIWLEILRQSLLLFQRMQSVTIILFLFLYPAVLEEAVRFDDTEWRSQTDLARRLGSLFKLI